MAAGLVLGAIGLAVGGPPLMRQAVAGAAGPAPPVEPSSARLTQVELERLRASIGAPAMAAAAQVEQGPLSVWVTGVRERGQPDLATESDCWHLGSITKSMTAMLVARCVEAGVAQWSDTIGAVLGRFAPDMRAEYRDATFLHLLSHRAGLQTDVIELGVIGLPFREPDPRESRRVIVRHALRQQPVGPPEQTFLYSQSGYVIAAAMLETMLDAPWEELLRRFVLAPLGMLSAGFGPPGADGQGGQPVGHASWITRSITPHAPDEPIADAPVVWGPAGSVHASLPDLITYLNAHRDRGRLLRRESWERLHTPPFGGDYALGWYLRNGGLWHNGTNSMWYAEVLIDTEGKRSAAAVTNDGRISTVTPIVHAALTSAIRRPDVVSSPNASQVSAPT